MRKVILAICCSSGLIFSHAQHKKPDSLLFVLRQHPASDTTRLKLLNDLAYELYSTEPEKGLLYADTAIALGKQIRSGAQLGIAYRNKALNYWRKSEFVFSLKYSDSALQIFEELHDRSGTARIYNDFGVTLKSMGDFPKSLEYYHMALKIYEQLDDKYLGGSTLMNIALIYNSLAEYDKALEYFNKAAASAGSLNDKMFNANLWSNMASTYDYLEKTEASLSYYDKAGKLYEELGNKAGQASNLLNIAVVYLYTGQYEHAWDKLFDAERLYLVLGDKFNLSLLCYQLAYLFSNAEDALFREKGLSPSQRQQLVFNRINKGLDYAKQAASLSRKGDGLMLLSAYYEENKQFEKALETYKTYEEVKDSINYNSKKQAISRQEMLYEFEMKEALTKAEHDKQQALAQAQIKQQQTIRNGVIAGTIILLISAALLFFSYKKRRDAQEQQKEAEFNAQVSDTEMKALRSQMNPHFIFNSLNSINDYIDKNETGTASLYITKFAKLMRMILENSEQKEVSLDDDLKALELYMQLEALRMKNKFTYTIQVEDTIDRENILVPPLILQPFVENSIWHGIAKKEGEGKINIFIKKEGEMINCIVEDNGIGREKSAKAKSLVVHEEKQSLGMKITKARIDILNTIKKSKAGVELTDLAEGLKVEVRLPMELSF